MWKKYTGYDQWDQSSSGLKTYYPGPIDTSNLFAGEGTVSDGNLVGGGGICSFTTIVAPGGMNFRPLDVPQLLQTRVTLTH